MKRFAAWLREEAVATNAMGSSGSTAGAGAIDTYDPLLRKKPLRRGPAKEPNKKVYVRTVTR